MPNTQMHDVILLNSNDKSTRQTSSFGIRTIQTQRPKSGEILVAPLKVGVCGTDWQIARRARSDNATILGHEGVAEIVEVGSDVTNFYVGQRVIFNPVDPHEHDRILGHSTQGLLQQYRCISQRELASGMIIPFDNHLPTICAPLIEPLGTVIYGRSLVGQVINPRSIAIFGGGSIGLLHALCARMQGCSEIFLIHNRQERLDWAVEQEIIAPDNIFLDRPDLDTKILERTNGKGVDAAYICTPRYSSLAVLVIALKCMSSDGCIDLVGGFADGDSIPDLPGIDLNAIRRSNHCGLPSEGIVKQVCTTGGKQVFLTGHRGTANYHLQSAMQIIDDSRVSSCFIRPIEFIKLISHVIPFNRAASILDLIINTHAKKIDNQEYIKIVIDFESNK
jgi:2-epi-valiolone-7-phosphate 1-reductase